MTAGRVSNKTSIINGGEGSPFKYYGNLDNENQTKIHPSRVTSWSFFQNHDSFQATSFCPWNMKSQQIWEEQKTGSSLPALSRVWTRSFHLRITPTSGTHSMDADSPERSISAPHLKTRSPFKSSVKVMLTCFKFQPSDSSSHDLYDLLITERVLIKRKGETDSTYSLSAVTYVNVQLLLIYSQHSRRVKYSCE